VLAGRDVRAAAQTGTGKTAAFVLPILHKLCAAPGDSSSRRPRALVLTPTRELAAQVAENARTYGKYIDLRTHVVFGGVSINPQIAALRGGCDLLIATPGRLLDLADQRAVDLRNIQCFVLDEADRMLDMGFIHAIRKVLELLPAQRQNLMFSATYSDDIRALANRFLRNPVTIEVAARNATADRVEQQVYRVPKEHKRHLLAHLIGSGSWSQVLVFTRTKHGANRLTQQLEDSGIRAAAIHGNKSQNARERALSDFKARQITALVATEVAARGLDIKELPQVVNFELPNVPEDYVHRIGRTARAGGSGCAISLVSPDETPLLQDIEKLLKRSLPVTPLPEYSVSSTVQRSQTSQAVQRSSSSRPQQERGASQPRQRQPRRAENGRQRDQRRFDGGHSNASRSNENRHQSGENRNRSSGPQTRRVPDARGSRDPRRSDDARRPSGDASSQNAHGSRDAGRSGDARRSSGNDRRGPEHRSGPNSWRRGRL
jgi:ATP-dependent RNA helicase RhlE